MRLNLIACFLLVANASANRQSLIPKGRGGAAGRIAKEDDSAAERRRRIKEMTTHEMLLQASEAQARRIKGL